MGNINTIPVVSQIKSAVEACGGDLEAARRTQEEFSRKCIVVSQIRSAVEAGLGDFDAALETQLQFASGIDVVPVLSQIKSAVQAGCGDMEAASKTQEAFSKECVIVSQLRSSVEAGLGDFDAASETQLQFLRGTGPIQLGLIGGAILSPLLTAVSIAAIGFGMGGISAGSFAAALMSSYGGNVTAGSLCAFLQSIGASGMSSGLSVSLGVLGGGVGSSLLALNHVAEGDEEEDEGWVMNEGNDEDDEGWVMNEGDDEGWEQK